MDHKITLAYLIFRIADTLEDADHLHLQDRQSALYSLSDLLDDRGEQAAEEWTFSWNHHSISEDENYNRLLRETPQVIRGLRELDRESAQIIVRHAKRSVQGMAKVLKEAEGLGQVRLLTFQDLREYCYFVAGIVGELITELFISECQQLGNSSVLKENGASFGEGLQLVNILKDSDADKKCGRVYLPTQTPIEEVYNLAFEDLRMAEKYVQALRDSAAPPGYIAFCDAPVQLAHATLREVKEHGPGSKVSRSETMRLLRMVMQRSGLADLG